MNDKQDSEVMTTPLLEGVHSVTLYSAWFCPYAQRAWAALNLQGIPHKPVEGLVLDDDWTGYVKDAGLLRVNKRGLVPTVVFNEAAIDDPVGTGGEEVLTESLPLLSRLLSATGAAPTAAEERFAARTNERVCSQFYRVLCREDAADRAAAWALLVEHLGALLAALEGGPEEAATGFVATVDGAPAQTRGRRPGLVDLVVFPWLHRLGILTHYRGAAYDLSRSALGPEGAGRVRAYAARIAEFTEGTTGADAATWRPVGATLADWGELVRSYARYFDGTARSKVGRAVRAGGQAHELSDTERD